MMRWIWNFTAAFFLISSHLSVGNRLSRKCSSSSWTAKVAGVEAAAGGCSFVQGQQQVCFKAADDLCSSGPPLPAQSTNVHLISHNTLSLTTPGLSPTLSSALSVNSPDVSCTLSSAVSISLSPSDSPLAVAMAY